MTEPLPAKLIGEALTVEFNFTDVMLWAETLESASVTVAVFAGLDYSPENVLSGTANILGNVVSQQVHQGLPGVIYLLIATAEGSGGNTYVKIRKLAVISDDGSFLPSSLVQLIGTLPDAVIGSAYSHNLDIVGGYPPYRYDGIESGTAPFWMNFHVEEDQLVCAGLPNETVATEYLFSPRIADAANNLADAPQDILVAQMILAGHVSDGYVDQVSTGSYSQTYGTEPVTYTVFSGTFPPGLTLATDGSWSGTFTTGDVYSWTIQGEDALGNFAYLNDSNVVTEFVWFANYASPANRSAKSTYGMSWDTGVLDGSGWLYYVDGVLYRSAGNAQNSVYKSLGFGDTWIWLGTTGSVSTGGGRLCFGGGYIFLCAGVWPLRRYNTSWTTPTGANESRANSAVFKGNTLYLASSYSNKVSKSINFGSSYTLGTNAYATGSNGSPLLITDDVELLVAYNDSSGFVSYIKSSTTGDSWTTDFTFPTAGVAYTIADAVYTGRGYIVAQRASGAIAYNTGAGWMLSATTISGNVNQFAIGEGKILAGCDNGNVYQTLDDGATWTLVTKPASASIISGISWIYP